MELGAAAGRCIGDVADCSQSGTVCFDVELDVEVWCLLSGFPVARAFTG